MTMTDMLPMCQNCKKRPGIHNYSQDATAFAHGWYEKWCEICVLEVQVKHARAVADTLPELERKLALLLQEETDTSWTARQLAIREQARAEIPKLREQAEQGIAVLRNKMPSNSCNA